MTNPTAPCARPGCGAPKAWHTNTSSIAKLSEWEGDTRHPWAAVCLDDKEGQCVGASCACTAYISPEPPQPERTAYVVEMTWPALPETVRVSYQYPGEERHDASIPTIPLADYLASHPQSSEPAPALCICGGEADDHDPVTGRCSHSANWRPYGPDADNARVEVRKCYCRKFEARGS